MAFPDPSAAGAGAGGESTSQAATVEPIRMPTVEEIKGQDIWNNCAVRSVVSGVMGLAAEGARGLAVAGHGGDGQVLDALGMEMAPDDQALPIDAAAMMLLALDWQACWYLWACNRHCRPGLGTRSPQRLLPLRGGGLGVLMGLFFGALDNPIMAEEMTARQQIVYTAKQMGRRSISNAKTFAVMGLIFSAAECTIEKVRAKHDTTNTAVAGCVTGGALAVKGGPKATCIGCAGLAAFSVAIEKFFDRHT